MPLYQVPTVVRCHLPILVVLHLLMACASTPEPGVTGIYESWDDVMTRWIGQSKEALYY